MIVIGGIITGEGILKFQKRLGVGREVQLVVWLYVGVGSAIISDRRIQDGGTFLSDIAGPSQIFNINFELIQLFNVIRSIIIGGRTYSFMPGSAPLIDFQ